MANYNLFDAASLAMVPTGIKDGKLYSVKPNDGAGDFTFSRGTDLTATRVNADGLIEKGRTNELLKSNSFSTTWNSANVVVTSGQSGYDGTNDAWLLSKAVANGNMYQVITTTSGVQSFSVYAKAGTNDWIRLRFDNTSSSDQNVWFNLTDGSVGTDQGISSYSENIGGGWYRLVLQANTTDLNNVRIYPAEGDTDTSATSGSIYIQDAQLEQGLVATDYIETTTAPVSAGITENLPRIDYSGGCGSLLLEPQRVNLVTQSELVTTSITNVGYTASENDATSPEGVVNAGKILETTGTTHLVQKTFSVASTTASYAVSFFVKGIGRTRGTISYELNGAPYNSVSATFNLAEETITDAVASGTGAVAGETDIIPMGNDWYRITLSGVVGIAGTHFVRLFGRDDSGNTSYVGDPTKGFNVYGFQAEAGSYPTSYIPTYGSAATRTVDEANITSATDLIGQKEGVIFVEKFYEGHTDSNGSIPLSIDGNSGYKLYIWFKTNGELLVDSYNGLVSTVSTGAGYLTPNTNYKVAVLYNQSTMSLYVNGVKIGSVSNPNLPASFGTLRLQYITGEYRDNRNKQTLIYKTSLTHNELSALTRPYDTYQEWVDGEGLTWESKSCTVQNIVELQNL